MDEEVLDRHLKSIEESAKRPTHICVRCERCGNVHWTDGKSSCPSPEDDR